MFRRSRFNARPNVGTVGRAAATPQETPSSTQDAGETPKDVSESSTATAVADNTSVVTPSEKSAAPGDGNDQNVEGTSSSAAVQRRKRFSIKPKVAPGRPSAAARMTKSPVKAVSETPVDVPDKSTGTTAAPQRLQSPRRRRPSEESKQPKPSLISSDGSEPPAAPTAVDSAVCSPADSGKEVGSTSGSQVKEVPSRPPEKVIYSIPDREAIALSEKAKTLMSSKSGPSLSPPAFSLSRLLNDPSDLQRLAKARKLRDLLKQEMHKEKKQRKTNKRVREYNLDPAKMTMRDLIRYLPLSNPMTSSLEDSGLENETVVPTSPVRDESPERAQEPAVVPKIASPREEEEDGDGEEAAEGAEGAEEDEDDGVMVPQVKVAEDGSLIIDEESLTVEVQRAKGPNLAQERDPIFERGSTTTYSSFRKGTYSKPWSSEETDMFFLAISMVGTDFSMICQLFPHRARSEIKNKFKKEEKENSWRIDKAFRERRKLDIEYFSKLLEKILEVQKNRKKLKALAGKKSPKKSTRKPKGKKASRKLSVVEEEDEEEQSEIPDLEEEEEEGEKENEDLCNEGGTAVAQPKKKRKRKSKQDASTEEPNDKKNKTGEKTTEQDEANTPGDAEAALPEDRPASDMSEKTEKIGEVKDATIKPAKLSRGRAPKPLLPLGRKWGKKAAAAATKTDDSTPHKGDESGIDGASEEQVNKDAESPLKQADNRQSANDDEEDAAVQPPRPTRYGRVPKATKLLNYPAKEETAPTSPTAAKPKCPAKRGRSSKLQSAQESKKPKLVTLKATQSEYGDEEDDEQREEEEELEEEQDCSSLDGSAPVYVPASLRSPNPVISEVEETMEELDILANMPDVLGISQDALCPDAFCERAHNETGTAEPCEHQLDLLVDVIDFLSSDHTEVSVSADESYNEAAQTLLTIGNLAHLTQSAQNQIDMQDDVTGTTSVSVNETSQPLEKEIASKPAVQEEIDSTPLQCAASDRGVTETVPTVEPRSSTTDNDDVSVIERIDSDVDPTPLLQSPESSKTSSPQTRRGRVSRVKPKPNLGQASRTAQVKSQPETSKVRTSEGSHSVPQTTDTPPAAEETSETADCSKRLSKDDVACIKVKHTVETSGSQERSIGPLEPSRKPATTDSRFASPSTEEAPMSQIETAESISSNLLTLDAAVTESQIGLESNVVSAPVPESSNRPAPCVAPVEELPVEKMEENQVASTQQTRKSRFQKVKPKVNLAQASRVVPSKPQTTKDAVEKDPTPDPTFNEKPAVEAKAESICSTSPEKPSQSHDPASDLIPSLDLGMTLTPTEELSSIEQKNPDVGVVVQVESDSAASHQSVSESLSEAQFEPSKEKTSRDTMPTSDSTDEKLTSHVGHTQGITEFEVGRGSDSVPIQDVEESPVRQEEEVKSAFRTTRGRLQKVKPNLPQTSRGARSKPQTTKDAVEKDPTPDPKFNEKPAVEAKAESTCSASPEKPSQSHDPASDLLPSLDLGMTLTPTEELSTTKQKNPDVGVVVQVESDAAASHQSASESQNLSETQFEASKEQTSSDAMLTSKSTDKKWTSHVGHTERIPESEVGRGSDSDSVPVQEVEESPVRQEEEVKPAFQTTRGRLQKVKPNLPQMSRGARSKPQTTKDPIAPTQPAETPTGQTSRPKSTDDTLAKVEVQPTCSTNPETLSQTASVSLELHSTHKTTEELSSSEEQKAQVGRGLDSTSEGSQQNVPRRRFPKVKPRPNLGSSPRTARAKLQPDDGGKAPEPQPVDNNGAQTEQEPVESGESLDGRNNKGTSSDGVVIATPRVAESRSASTDSVVENKSDEKLTDESTREETSTNESQDAVQLRPETSQTAAQSTVDKKSEATESPSRKGPQARRGRLIKPIPRLGRSTIRPPQPKQVQNTKQAEADFGTCSERVSEHPAGIQQPVEGAIEQVPDSCTRDASTSRTGTQHSPDLTLFPDLSVLSQPSDPDEPFFILSLTEIPVCPSGEVEEPPLPYLPPTDASTQQCSDPGDVTEPVSMETPVDPHENTTVHPAELPETGENTDETGIPPTNQRPVGTRRRAKLEPDTTKGEQASRSVAAKEVESAQRSELAGPSVLPDAVDDAVNEPQGGSSVHVGGGERPENSGSEAQTSRARGTRSSNRNTNDSLSLSPETTTTALAGDSGHGRAASRGRKVRTRGGKRSTPMRSAAPPTLSTSSITSPTPTELQDVTRTSEGGPSPDASSCPAEVSVAMETSSIEVEPTNVSQYFLSDIFTDVDET